MSQALYRKWRPRQWDQVAGQEHIIQTLRNAIRTGRIGHAYLFSGPRGTGKTTTARLLAKAVNCLSEDLAARPCDVCSHCIAVNDGRFLDLIEIDAASNTSVDDVRELREKINYVPNQGKYKVYIIDEVHMLSTAAFNALLKTLEEPPAHAIFVLATTEVHKIPATVLSRCQRHEFRRIPVNEIVKYLGELCTQEGIQVEPAALSQIARQATGSMRDAISLLDQLASTGEAITLGQTQDVLGTATSQSVVDLVSSILSRKPADAMNVVHNALDGGSDPRQYSRQIVDYLRALMLIRMGCGSQVEATQEMRAQMAEHALAYQQPALRDAILLFNAAATDNRSTWQPGLPLEIALSNAIDGLDTPAPPAEKTAPDMPFQKASSRTNQMVAEQPLDQKISESPSISTPVPESPPAALPAEVEPGTNPVIPESTTMNQGVISLTSIEQYWSRITAAVRSKRGQTDGLLNSSKRLAIKDNCLVLGFSSDVLKSKMESQDHIQVTCAAIQEVVGIDLGIICVVSSLKGGTPTDLDIDRDGMVGTALNLGGKIVRKE